MPRKGSTKTKPAVTPAEKLVGKTPKARPAAVPVPEGMGLIPPAAFYDDVKRLMETAHAAGTYRDVTLPQATMKILKGLELGLHPTQALRHIWITEKGDLVADSAELFRALIQRSGGSLVPTEMTPEKCKVVCQRGSISGVFEYTVQEAIAQGLVGHGGTWDKNRADMLFARATTRAARAMFADVIAGLSYTIEEMGGAPLAPPSAARGGEAQPSPKPPQAAAKREKVPDAGNAVPDEEIDGRKATVMVQVQDANGIRTIPSVGISTQQLLAVRALMTKYGANIRPVYDAFMGELGLRRLTALTEKEGGTLIARLQGTGAEPEVHPPAATAPAAPLGASTEGKEPPAVKDKPKVKTKVKTHAQALAELKAVVAEMEFPWPEIELILASHLNLADGKLDGASVADLADAQKTLEQLHLTEGASLLEAIRRAHEMLQGEGAHAGLPGGPY
jgi:hypothetical protein